jgi:hypothetical protein
MTPEPKWNDRRWRVAGRLAGISGLILLVLSTGAAAGEHWGWLRSGSAT